MSATVATRWIEALDLDECWDLLASRSWGRLAVVVDDHPEIFPIDHAVDRRAIVLHTEAGAKLRNAAGTRVAFEIDDIDEDRCGWSVQVVGHAEEVFDLRDLPVATIASGAADAVGQPDELRWIRVVPVKVTGRRVRRH